ncbi:MAG: hypothetical protein COT85_04135 [Chlamydiae bacterium CG10_big_fil_rev_8_21_14_0_10_42_34]|nr:MAG: hypothetical protein COT85_04135 [Chlamydiae bacterium CG10_big_fil_rev_8_21_14_0_10_42_34]
MNKIRLLLVASVLGLLAGCSSISLLFVDTEKLANEIKELETLLAITESDDQLTQQAIRRYFSKCSLSPILDTRRPIVVQKEIFRLAAGNDILIMAECQQDQFVYHAAFSVLKQPSGNWEFVLLYLTPDKNCLISPRLFQDIVKETSAGISVMDISNCPVLVKLEGPQSDDFSAYTWTFFKKQERMHVGVICEPCNTGGTDFKFGLLKHVKNSP